MKRREFICVLGSIASGFWPRHRTIIVVMAAMVVLPVEVSHAGWLSDLFKGSKQSKSSRQAKPAKHVRVSKPAVAAKRAVSPKRHAVRLAALGPVHLSPAALKPAAARCDPAKFRIVLDVGHTAELEGAMSARNVSEFVYNLRLARRIEEKLKAEGFAETRLLLTEGKARRSLVKRVAAANDLPADLLLRSTMTPCPANSSRIGNSRERKAVSATASADIPCSSPAAIRTSRPASRLPN